MSSNLSAKCDADIKRRRAENVGVDAANGARGGVAPGPGSVGTGLNADHLNSNVDSVDGHGDGVGDANLTVGDEKSGDPTAISLRNIQGSSAVLPFLRRVASIGEDAIRKLFRNNEFNNK